MIKTLTKQRMLSALILVFTGTSDLNVSAQTVDQLDPSNFSSQAAKKIASLLNKTDELKKYEINFINSSSASLKCKLSVNGIWEMVMRNKASLIMSEDSDRKFAEAGFSRKSEPFSSSMQKAMIRETLLSLDKIDEMCGAKIKKN